MSNVTASLRFEVALGLDATLSTGGGADLLGPGAGVIYSTTPTISYAPLQGEEFLKNVLTPVSLESLFVLMQSGWRADRVLGICVERINDLENAPTASGPTPDRPPARFRDFARLLLLLEEARNEDLIRSKIDPESKKLLVQIKSAPGDEDTVREIKDLLKLDPALEVYSAGSDFLDPSPDTIAIRTRSIMSILFYLSQSVATPKAHQEAGLVTVTRNADGSEFDWRESPGGSLFEVRHGQARPDSPFLAVPYRGHWFYIADDDLESKSSFMLMTQLFNLKAGKIESSGPTLTIPVSR